MRKTVLGKTVSLSLLAELSTRMRKTTSCFCCPDRHALSFFIALDVLERS